MNIRLSISIALLTVALFSSVSAQRTVMSGRVIEVATGDTMVVQTTQAKFTVKLQFVDAPESTQPLYELVKTHLSNFVRDKEVVFELKSLSDGTHRSKVLLRDVDLSLQLLRDGAVWYSVPDATAQQADEKTLYLNAESMAKSEKRGVWGVVGLKPAYELRLERERALAEKLAAERKKWLESALALMKFNEPAVGMNYFSFESLCSPAQSGDRTYTFDSKGGQSISKSLVWTKDRDETKCYGTFDFDLNMKLTNITRSSTAQ